MTFTGLRNNLFKKYLYYVVLSEFVQRQKEHKHQGA